MVHRLHTPSRWGVISRLIPLLVLGAPLTGCREADSPLAPTIDGPQFNHVPGHLAGLIAFHSTRDGDFEIFVMNADGSGVTQVTNTGSNVDPIWSPDGRRIAFAGFRSGRAEVFVINVNGTGETQLTTEGGFPGAWSPDGTRIAFANSGDGDDEIFITNLDGTGVTRLTDNSFRDFPTAWSPNGEQILFQSDRDGNTELYVMNVDGTGVTRLTDNPASDEGDRAGWSPDGTRIVFSSTRDGGDLDVFAMNSDGTGVTQLTADPAADDDPVWSPNGSHIAFHSTRDGDEEIFIMNGDGTGVTQLTFNEGVFDAVPVWIERASSANNDFADATVIAMLPFSDTPDLLTADLEAGEPMPSCSFGAAGRTVWYSFTPPQAAWVAARTANEPFAVVAIYRGSALSDLSEVGCRVFGERLVFQAEGGTTYYFQVGGLFGGAGPLEFHVEEIFPPQNDAFVNATPVPGVPFDDEVDLAAATTEAGEPAPSCFGVNRTVWYAFTPAETTSISASPFTLNIPVVLAAYRGGGLANLTELGCRVGQKVTFWADAGTTYYFQVGVGSVPSFPVAFHLEVTPPPDANFGFSPGDPSMFDVVQFFSFASDPGDVGFGSLEWSFGDGSSGTDCCPTHRYAADGDYTVQHTATTLDDRTGSRFQTVSVRTHDVAVTRFFAPKSASAGQTRGIVVGISNRRYPETVDVQLFKSVPGGFEFVGALSQPVPVHAGNRTTDFTFSYTFTAADASVGKVTFKAVAVLAGARDALPADNEAIGSPTRVSR